jgi:hypothetical protein
MLKSASIKDAPEFSHRGDQEWETAALDCLFRFGIPGDRDANWGSYLNYKIHNFFRNKNRKVQYKMSNMYLHVKLYMNPKYS